MQQRTCQHLAVIMDGNRRWAKERDLASFEGHQAGVDALKNLVRLAPDYGIEYLTTYAFSTENWKRAKHERDFIFKLLKEVALKELVGLAENNVKVSFIGDLTAFSDDIQMALEQLRIKTQNNTGLKLQLALNYGAIDEMQTALKKIKQELSLDEIQQLSVDGFNKFLYSKDVPAPNILLRTGGERRLSNYLLWQSANAHLVFLETLWPDFGGKELESVLERELSIH